MENKKLDAGKRRKAGGLRIFIKPRFHGKSFFKAPKPNIDSENSLVNNIPSTSNLNASTSSKKLTLLNHKATTVSTKRTSLPNNKLNFPHCYIMLDSFVLKSIIDEIAMCPECQSRSIELSTDLSRKKGLSVLFEFTCTDSVCSWSKRVYTSQEIDDESHRQYQWDVNMSSIIVMKEIGKGHAALTTFCGFMNLPPPMHKKTFHDIQRNILVAYKQVALNFMNRAAVEIKQGLGENKTDITVSCDGTW